MKTLLLCLLASPALAFWPFDKPKPTPIVFKAISGTASTIDLTSPDHRLRHPNNHKGWKPKVRK
jgi:hypothetical protein